MQIINPNYSTLNAEQTAAIALNTSHVAGDGSDHADVATNTSDIATNAAAVALNTTHRGSDGSDHSLSHTQGTDTTLGTMTGNIAMDGHSLTGAGIISGGLDVVDVSENTALTAAQCLGQLILVSAACTVTLPAVSTVAEGGHVTVYSTGANLVKIDLNSSDRFILDGTALTDDHMLDSESAAGDYVTVIKDSAVGWTVVGRSGTWTDGGTS